MAKLVRRIFKVILLLVLLLFGLALAFVLFFDANRLKPMIINRVYQMTGYELVMDGSLSWSFFPSLGLSAGHLGLKNPPGSKHLYLIEADRARLSMRLLPLLHRRVEAGTVSVMNARVELSDPANPQQVFSISHLNAYAENIRLDRDFSARALFDYKSTAPAMTGRMNITGQASLKPDAKTFSLRDLTLKGDVQAGISHVPIRAGGRWVLNWQKQTFAWDDLKGTLANMPVSGNLSREQGVQPLTTGTLHIAPFDLKKFLQQTGMDMPILQSAEEVEGKIDLTMTPAEMNISGALNAPAIQVANLRVKRISVPFHLGNGILDIQNAKGSLYQGSGTFKAVVKMQMNPWQTAIQMGLNGVQLEPLLRDLDKNNKLTVSGTANVDMILSSSGTTAAVFLDRLNGSIRFGVNQAVLHGVDVPFYIDTARQLAGSRVSPHFQGSTALGTLSGTALVRNGVVSNQDLTGSAPRFTLKGWGAIDLSADKIEYALQVHLQKSDSNRQNELSNLFGLPIPVTVSGSLSAPQVSFDKKAFVQALAKQQIQKAADKLIPKELEGKLPPEAGHVLNQLLGQ